MSATVWIVTATVGEYSGTRWRVVCALPDEESARTFASMMTEGWASWLAEFLPEWDDIFDHFPGADGQDVPVAERAWLARCPDPGAIDKDAQYGYGRPDVPRYQCEEAPAHGLWTAWVGS